MIIVYLFLFLCLSEVLLGASSPLFFHDQRQEYSSFFTQLNFLFLLLMIMFSHRYYPSFFLILFLLLLLLIYASKRRRHSNIIVFLWYACCRHCWSIGGSGRVLLLLLPVFSLLLLLLQLLMLSRQIPISFRYLLILCFLLAPGCNISCIVHFYFLWVIFPCVYSIPNRETCECELKLMSRKKQEENIGCM